jgi:hypothetical protein
MRKYLILLLPLLLTACVDDSASYYVDGNTSGHALTVHRAQARFWSSEASVELIMSRLPDCQRRVVLETTPAEEVEIELYSSGDNLWTLKSGQQTWQVDTQTCTQYAEAKGDPGDLVGVFRDENGKLAFAAAVSVPAGQAENAAPAVAVPAQPQEAAPAAPAATPAQ